ncbi:MAG: YicC/YloC family endoribonuclease [Oscillospiraceae bacterium]
MIRSMTGYGRGEEKRNDRTIVVEVRAVNNRYLDCTVKLPRAYIFAEDAIKARVQKEISRGKVDVFVTVVEGAAEGATVTVNQPVAEGYLAALHSLRDTYSLTDDISVSLLAGFPEVLMVEKAKGDTDEIAADLCAVLDLALADFNTMRAREGEKLAEDLLSRAKTIETLTAYVEERSPQTVSEYRTRLGNKMAEVLQNSALSEDRILTEAAIYADKVAVDEETVRLRSHLSQLKELLAKGGATGRKLDFLIQEFNREANTIGSKCGDIEMTRHVVDIKAEIEKIREQVQNIE